MRYISEESHRSNMTRQLSMTPQTLAQLQRLGVNDAKQLKLEYFFYTNALEKAQELSKVLTDRGYTCDINARDTEYSIAGWSIPVQMTSEIILQWTETMCGIGYAHDCEFDGWGTNPDQ